MHAGSQECTFPRSCVLESSLETLLESSVRRFSWVLFFRHAWLNLLSEHISAGRINQVSWPNRDSWSKYRGFSREHTQTFHTRNRAVFEIFTQNHTFFEKRPGFRVCTRNGRGFVYKKFLQKIFLLEFFRVHEKRPRICVCAMKRPRIRVWPQPPSPSWALCREIFKTSTVGERRRNVTADLTKEFHWFSKCIVKSDFGCLSSLPTF